MFAADKHFFKRLDRLNLLFINDENYNLLDPILIG